MRLNFKQTSFQTIGFILEFHVEMCIDQVSRHSLSKLSR